MNSELPNNHAWVERVLQRGDADHRVLIGRPTAHPQGDYVCTCTLVGPDGHELWKLDVGGIDEIQAITLALLVIGERLAVESPPFTFLGAKELGFPRQGKPWGHQ